MSRIGKQPVVIPEGVTATIDQNTVTVKGPKGELNQAVHRLVNVVQKDNQILVTVKDSEEKKQRALWGLSTRLIANMVIGVTEGFSKQLEVRGVGFKSEVSNKVLTLNVGYSHPVEYKIQDGIEINVEKNIITVSGIDKQKVGQVSAEIRAVKKPEPYKGKGIRYVDEVVRKKAGKTATKGE